MKLDFEYGNGLMSAELPDNTCLLYTSRCV